MVNLSKSPLLGIASAFAVGIAASIWLQSPGFIGLIVVVALTLILHFSTRQMLSAELQRLSKIAMLLCFVTAGWVLGEISAIIPASDPGHFIGESLEVEGFVADDVQTGKMGHKTILQVTAPIQGKVMLFLPSQAAAPRTNDRLRGTIHVQPLPTKNPGYAQWLEHRGIHAVAKASSMTKIGVETGFLAWLHELRGMIAGQFASKFPDAVTAGLGNAMLLGDRTELDGELRKDFSATGLSHIVAISGMNFAIIYGVLTLLLKPLLHLRRGRLWRSLIIVPLLAFFALLTGANPAIVRAAIMLGMLDLSQAFWSKSNSLNALATSAMIFLVYDPQSLFTPDFQLSYAAVLGILLLQNPILHYFHLRLPKLPKWIASGLAVTLAAQAATTPFVLFHFHTFPTYFLLANLVVLPFVTLVVQVGFAGFLLAWIPGIGEIWGSIMDFLLWLILSMADLLAQLPGATITALEVGQVGIWMLIGQAALCFVLLERKLFLSIYRDPKSLPMLQTPSGTFQSIQRRLGFGALMIGFLLLGLI